MKKVLLSLLILYLSLSFAFAADYYGDGTYNVNLEEKVTFIADNGWKLDLVDYKEYGMYKYNSGLFFEVTSPEGTLYNFDSTIGNNPDATSKIQVNSTQSSSEGVLEISIYNSHEGGYYSNKEITITSLVGKGQSKYIAGKSGFFKRTWAWFKCLFSKKC